MPVKDKKRAGKGFEKCKIRLVSFDKLKCYLEWKVSSHFGRNTFYRLPQLNVKFPIDGLLFRNASNQFKMLILENREHMRIWLKEV